MINEKYIRFDWAAKRMLRDKVNFAVPEGLMTVLIGEQVKIEEILESEGNQDTTRLGIYLVSRHQRSSVTVPVPLSARPVAERM